VYVLEWVGGEAYCSDGRLLDIRDDLSLSVGVEDRASHGGRRALLGAVGVFIKAGTHASRAEDVVAAVAAGDGHGGKGNGEDGEALHFD
jgi:hypothetical protein